MTKRLLPLLLVSVAVFIVVACAEGEGATATPSAPAAPAATATPIPAPTPAVVPAPIEDITIQKWAAKPPNSTMIVTSGLPNGCASFNDYTISRDGDVFTLQVTNLDTGGPGIGCTEIYGYVTTKIALDDLGGVVACEDYTVIANGDALTVRADPLGGISGSEPDCDDSSVSTSASDPVQPAWLGALTHRLAHEPVTNPPSSVTQYQYAGETVYFIPQVCCDITSVVYDAEGVVIGQPDGGITGQGDGRLPGFFQERTDGKLIWEDDRTNEPGLAQAPAPIESVQILVLESFPPQYSAVVVSGLRNSCVSFGGYRLGRQGETFHVDLLNLEPTDQSRACNELYRTVETFIGLGSDLESGVEYTVDVNGTIETFTAQ